MPHFQLDREWDGWPRNGWVREDPRLCPTKKFEGQALLLKSPPVLLCRQTDIHPNLPRTDRLSRLAQRTPTPHIANMPSRARAVSPAASENEVDISGSLFADDAGPANAKHGAAFDVDDIFAEAAQDGEGDDDDEAFIALKQAASFRKSSNLKGKTVKKGGGFQARGMSFPLLAPRSRRLCSRCVRQASMPTSCAPSPGRASPSPRPFNERRSP